MMGIISTLIIFILILIAIFGGLCLVTGEENKGNQIIVSCMTALILFMMIVVLFQTSDISSGIFTSGIPLIENVQKAGSIKDFMANSPGKFALDFVELVTIMLLINWVSNIYKAADAGFAGKVLSRIIIVCMAVIAYGFFMDMIRENAMTKWAVYCVECMITGTGILYTPAFILACITGWKKDNPAIAYAVSQFPKTNLGKAISTAISTSIVFVAFLIILETQYGSIESIMSGVMDSMETIGACILMLMGIYFMVMSLKKKN